MNSARLCLRAKGLLGPLRESQGHGSTRAYISSLQPQRYRTICPTRRSPFSTSTPTSSDNPNISTDQYTKGLAQNKEWAAQTAKNYPDLFPALAKGQSPQILWIGCSDSRCPETSVLDMQPGDVFVHRNIANILHAGDLSSSAVIEYAVRHLRVAHVVLCGHTSCGGVAAALGNKPLGILDPWLLPLRQIREQNTEKLQSLAPEQAALKMVELNVEEGVKALKQKSVVLEAMQERGMQVHGLIYDVGTGLLREVDTNESDAAIKARLAAFNTQA